MVDLRKFYDGRLFLCIIVAAAIVDTTGLFVWRYTSEPDAPITKWYDRYTTVAYVLDVSSMVIGMVLAQLITAAVGGQWNLIAFLIVVVTVQLTHDLFFSQVVVPMIPPGRNSIIDLMLEYSTMKGAGWVLVVDGIYMILTALLSGFLYSYPAHITWFAGLFTLYTTGYILYTHPSNSISK